MAKTNLYTVRGADIWTSEFGRVAEGDTVELEPAEARHFNGLGYLAPYIPDDEANEEPVGELDLRSPPLIPTSVPNAGPDERKPVRGPTRR